MKKLIWAVVVLILFIGTSILIEYKINKGVEDLLKDIQELTLNLQNEKWETVDNQFEEMVNIWEEKGSKWATIVQHNEIDQLTISLYKSKVYANFREKEEALAELKQFEFMIDHIPKINKIDLKNVL